MYSCTHWLVQEGWWQHVLGLHQDVNRVDAGELRTQVADVSIATTAQYRFCSALVQLQLKVHMKCTHRSISLIAAGRAGQLSHK
jgi:hypothetical protein